jgi:hypothetical protein
MVNVADNIQAHATDRLRLRLVWPNGLVMKEPASS